VKILYISLLNLTRTKEGHSLKMYKIFVWQMYEVARKNMLIRADIICSDTSLALVTHSVLASQPKIYQKKKVRNWKGEDNRRNKLVLHNVAVCTMQDNLSDHTHTFYHKKQINTIIASFLHISLNISFIFKYSL